MAPRILIVEDSALIVDAFKVLFADAGYDVDAASTIAEAVEAGMAVRPDVMLLDLTLPDGNGLDIMQALKERDSLPRVTLAMTGHNDAKSRRSCIEAGCADVLLKPVPIAELLRQIKRHLES